MIASHAWLALVTVLGAPATTPAAKAGPTVAAATPTTKPTAAKTAVAAKVDLVVAVATAEATLTAAKLPANKYDGDGAIARASGLDPDRLAAQLDALSAVCPAPTEVCTALLPHGELQDRLARTLGRLTPATTTPVAPCAAGTIPPSKPLKPSTRPPPTPRGASTTASAAAEIPPRSTRRPTAASIARTTLRDSMVRA